MCMQICSPKAQMDSHQHQKIAGPDTRTREIFSGIDYVLSQNSSSSRAALQKQEINRSLTSGPSMSRDLNRNIHSGLFLAYFIYIHEQAIRVPMVLNLIEPIFFILDLNSIITSIKFDKGSKNVRKKMFVCFRKDITPFLKMGVIIVKRYIHI